MSSPRVLYAQNPPEIPLLRRVGVIASPVDVQAFVFTFADAYEQNRGLYRRDSLLPISADKVLTETDSLWRWHEIDIGDYLVQVSGTNFESSGFYQRVRQRAGICFSLTFVFASGKQISYTADARFQGNKGDAFSVEVPAGCTLTNLLFGKDSGRSVSFRGIEVVRTSLYLPMSPSSVVNIPTAVKRQALHVLMVLNRLVRRGQGANDISWHILDMLCGCDLIKALLQDQAAYKI